MTNTLHDGTRDWFEHFCRRLDSLRINARLYQDPDEEIPPDEFYEVVRESVRGYADQADSPQIPSPDVWLGPNAEIGLTWDVGELSFDLIYSERQFLARLTTGLLTTRSLAKESIQEEIEPNQIPSVLAKLAIRT
jgi:hypothetical protein